MNAGVQPGMQKPSEKQRNDYAKGLLVLLVLSVAVLGLSTYAYLSHIREEARERARQQLSEIADLKLREISNWRKERLADARFFARARFVASDLKRLLNEPDSKPTKEEVLHWVRLLDAGDRYSKIIIYDPECKPRLAEPPEAEEPTARAAAAIKEAAQSRSPVMGDLHRDKDKVELNVVFPVFADADTKTGKLIASVLIGIDARQFLFPVIESIPTPSRTAETLLVRQEGESVVFLNDLRHRPDSAMDYKVPMSTLDLPAVKALRGETRVIDGVDYRGQPVVAAGRIIPETSWAIVAKVDRSEVYAPLRQRMLMALLLLGMGLLTVVLVVALLWRRRGTQFLKRELALEKERAELADRLALLMRHANDAMLLLSPDGRVIEANECASKIYGYSLEEIQQKRIHDLRPPGLRNDLDRRLEEIGKRGSLFYETVHQRKDGSTFPVEVSSRKVSVGNHEWIFSILRDITERKTAEEVLRRSEARLATAVQVGGLGTFEHDHQTGVLDFSPLMRELTGFEPNEPVSMEAFIERIVSEDRPIVHEAIQRGPDPAGSGTFSAVFRMNMPSGRLRWISARAQALHEGEGDARRPLRTLGAALDITEQRESQQRLETLVAERTSKLKDLVTELEHFSYTITHDMRAPLRAMQGFAEILMASSAMAGDKQAQGFLQRIRTSAERMDCLIRDALNYTKAIQTALPLEPIRADALLHDMLESYPELQPSRLSVEFAGEIPVMLANRAALTQCFSNLLTNAEKFAKPGVKPVVRVWAERRQDRVRVWVEDNGIGIPPSMLPKVFEMFSRGHKHYEGTGIGLALVRKVVERMGGQVGAESQEGIGSKFWVELKGADATPAG